MSSVTESCSTCKKVFDIQFRWQMEERSGGFRFSCSRACYEANSNATVTCSACGKQFVVDLVSQVVATRAGRKYACNETCRADVLSDVSGSRSILGAQPPTARPAFDAAGRGVPNETATIAGDPSSMIGGQGRTARTDEAREPRRATGEPVAREPRNLKESEGVAEASLLPRRIAVFNHKGGTGKTTTAVTLAAGLARKGKRVLLVDTDSQGNVGASLGISVDKSLYHVLVMGLSIDSAVQRVRPDFDILPSNETLAAAELYLAGRRERDRILRDRLAPALSSYDVVILDCSPSLSLLNQNALVFADALVIPVACDYLSLVGVRQVLKTLKHVNNVLHHPVHVGAIVPTMYDARAKICQDSLATLRDHFGARCLTPIRAATKLKEAPAHAKTIFEWAEGSPAALDYQSVIDSLLAGAAAPSSTAGSAPSHPSSAVA